MVYAGVRFPLPAPNFLLRESETIYQKRKVAEAAILMHRGAHYVEVGLKV